MINSRGKTFSFHGFDISLQMMKHFLLIIVLLFNQAGVCTILAQEESLELADSAALQPAQAFLTLQPLSIRHAPLWMHHGPLGTWDVHEGFNANVDMGVRIGWGKYNPWKGGSFFTHLNALYVQPLSQDRKWNLALGGYYSNFKMWGDRKTSVGLTGILDYQINERMNAGVFLVHDFGIIGDRHFPCNPFPWMENPSTTIGADWGIKVNEKVHFNVSMSYTHHHGNGFVPKMHPQQIPPEQNLQNGTDRRGR